MIIGRTIGWRTWVGATLTALVSATGWLAATPDTHPFTHIQNPFTRDLFATTGSVPADGSILGGVAFSPDGNVWSAECSFLGTRLHKFSSTSSTINGTSVRTEIDVVDLTTNAQYPDHTLVRDQFDNPTGMAGGCGLVNHPDGSMYSNSSAGIWQLDASNGSVIAGPFGNPGNALGIAVDPQVDAQGRHHIMYVGDDCHPALDPTFSGTTCTIWDLDPVAHTSTPFVSFTRAVSAFVDGIYFDPDGGYIFGAYREEDELTGEAHHSLKVIARDGAVSTVPMTSEPDGVAFHKGDLPGDNFVVTLNESRDCFDTTSHAIVAADPSNGVCPAGSTAGGTMTRFDFPLGFASIPDISTFATGGFRGDLLQVGADRCIYATQAPYEGGILRSAELMMNSPLVTLSSVSGLGPGDLVSGAGIAANTRIVSIDPDNFIVTLDHDAAVTDNNSFLRFGAGARYLDGTETFENSIVRICGGFVPPPGVTPSGTVTGTVFTDNNGDHTQANGEPGTPGVTVTVTDSTGTTHTTTTDSTGTFTVTDLPPGDTTVVVTPPPGTIVTEPPTVTVTPGGTTEIPPIPDVPLVTVTGTVTTTTGQPVPGVTVTETGTSNGETVTSTAITDSNGNFSFTEPPGTFTIEIPTPPPGTSLEPPTTTTVTTVGGETPPTVTFTLELLGSMSGVVYVDLNRNSLRDAGEPTLSGVTVTLSGPSNGTATTGVGGAYSFTALEAGNYTLTSPTTTQGFKIETTNPLTPTLSPGANLTDQDFGYIDGRLTGIVFADLDRDGSRDAGEPGLAGVTVTLGGASSATAVTDANGAYTFSGLLAGDYTIVSPATQQGLQLNTASPLTPTLQAGADQGSYDFGYVNGSLAGVVFADTNKNGIVDAGEPGMPGVTVTLGGAASATTMTGAGGAYTFSGLAAGSYTITAPSTAQGLALNTASPLTPTLQPGASQGGYDFGYITGSLAGVVYADLNKNGARDSGEPGLVGVTVTLSGASSASTTSGAGGAYSFGGLAAGTYYVASPATTNGLDLETASPLTAIQAAGQNRTGLDFGYVNGIISGFAYVDANGNSIKDGSEAGLANVTITLTVGASSVTTTTSVTGSYVFNGLVARNYSVSAPSSAGTYTLGTTSPLPVGLPVGGTQPNVNFGYNAANTPAACTGVIGDFVWVDVNRNGIQDAGEPGLSTPISLKNSQGAIVATTTSDVDGQYHFTALCAGSYVVEATTPAGYDQTGTAVGTNRAIDSNGTPASVTLPTDASTDQTIDFGFVNGFCEKQPVQTELNPAGSHFPANKGPDVIVRVHKGQSIQAALDQAGDANGDGYIIVAVVAKDGGLLGGNVTQQVVISGAYTKPFALIGCSVTLNDPTPGDGNPTARVRSTASAPADGIGARIFVMDLHAEDSAVAGWLVEGDNRYLRNVYGKHNAGIGVKFVGNSNTMHNGDVEQNQGVGLYVQGNSNTVTDTDAFSNLGHGFSVTGNSNQILKVDAGDKSKGNGGDGVHVEGAGNLIQEAAAFANSGDGIEVVASAGAPNIVKKAASGDKSGKANGGNGILVSGPGNAAASPIELEENTLKANGLAGIRITGTGHQLKNNVSGGTGSGETNVGCEFLVAAGNVNATGNKANGTTVAGSNGSAFPTSCVGSQ